MTVDKRRVVFKKIYILTFLMIGLLSAQSIAQGAQATMRVSVEVVSGSSVTMSQPSSVTLENDKASSLGVLTLKGMDKGTVLITNTKNVRLADGKGNEMMLNISSKESGNKDQETISYEGTSSEKGMVSSVYTGQLTTTIEYF